jgi:aryl-alcohol dehydrogenase-like predicted oxidoreductase
LRYRPFGRSGQAISAVTLALEESVVRLPEQADLISAALNQGINAYEARHDQMESLKAIAQALAGVDRKLVIVGLRIVAGQRLITRQSLIDVLQTALKLSGLGWIDYLLIEDPAPGELTEDCLQVLEAARSARRLRLAGVGGNSPTVDQLIGSGRIQLLALSYNLRSGWLERNRINLATAAELIILGHDYYPRVVQRAGVIVEEVEPVKKSGLFGLSLGKPKSMGLERTGPYAFLERVNGWTAHEVCLNFALTEPALASVRVTAADEEVLEGLAASVERELPSGLTAQIELARVAELS